jgi:hypothetical protein
MNTKNVATEIWDKKSPVNGIDAETVLANSREFRTSNVILVKVDDRITQMEIPSTLREIYKLEGTDEEVAVAYLEIVKDNYRPVPEPSPSENAKMNKLASLDSYDTSEAVNSFTIEGLPPCWITSADRSTYNASIQAAELLGETTVEIPLAGQFFTLPVSQAKVMLAMIQRYADKAAIVTAKHRAVIEALQTEEEVEAYDFTAGYPEKVTISL